MKPSNYAYTYFNGNGNGSLVQSPTIRSGDQHKGSTPSWARNKRQLLDQWTLQPPPSSTTTNGPVVPLPQNYKVQFTMPTSSSMMESLLHGFPFRQAAFQSQSISTDNPHVTITNSDIKLAATVLYESAMASALDVAE